MIIVEYALGTIGIGIILYGLWLAFQGLLSLVGYYD